jgi:hypothetical protein
MCYCSIEELRECFVRVLGNWGLWNPSTNFQMRWNYAFQEFLRALGLVLHAVGHITFSYYT